MSVPSYSSTAGGAGGKRATIPADPPTFSSLALLVSLSLLFGTVQSSRTLMIDVDAAPETNSSLQYHLCGLGNRELDSDTTLHLSGGVHHLLEGSFCLLQNLQNFTIQGQQIQPKTVIYCDSETEMRRGIAFFNISSLHLSHLEIINCGREIPTGLPGHVNDTFAYLGPLQKAAMIITHSTDVILQSVTINRCLGFGVLLINPLGQTAIKEVSVINTNSRGLSDCTHPLGRNDMLCSGSGIVVLYNDTDITDELVSSTGNYTVSLSILDCSFVNNTNFMPTSLVLNLLTVVGVGFSTERILLTGGFSLAIYIGQRDYFAIVNIANTKIVANTGNIANFIVMHYNTIRTGVTRIDGLDVRDNSVTSFFDMSRGGGFLVLLTLFFDMLKDFPPSQNDAYDIVEIDRSEFSRNSASYGGAILLYMTPQNISNVRLVIRDTSFTNNIAVFGSALYAFQFQSALNNRGAFLYMEDVTASNNTFPGSNISDNSPEQAGVFLVTYSSNITIVGTPRKGCIFRDNHVTVFAAVRANVVLRGKISFEGNQGFRGGALALVDGSILFIHNGSNLAFTRNVAFREGGAIYLNTLGSYVTETCAIQFFSERRITIATEDLELLDLSISFSNNSAGIAGNSIFGNPLYFCFFVPASSIDHINVTGMEERTLYNELFDFIDTVGNGLSEINSVEEAICVCKNSTYDMENCPPSYSIDDPIIPGDTFILYLTPVDISGTPVTSLLHSQPRPFDPSERVEIGVNQDIRSLRGGIQCSPVEFQLFAPENILLYVDLTATIGGQKLTVLLNTTSCPPGFVLRSFDSSRLSCLCSDFIETRLDSTCNLTDYTIARPTNYWIGTSDLNDGRAIIQFVSTCPINYCKEDVTEVDLRVSDQLCMEGRTGTLCGSCKEGLSSVFGAAECRRCSNAWLATLLLFALLGVLLTISFFVLDATITHGLVNGVFFYSNIVTINSNIFFRGNQTGFLFWYISWLNLDLGFPLCFYDGMTEGAKLGLQYIFPTYIMLMMVLLIALSQRSLLIQRMISQLDGIHGLVTMFYISFLKFVRIVIDTVTFVSLVSEDDKGTQVIWFFDGTQQPDNPLAVFFIILGTLTLVFFIIPYLVFCLFSTCIQRQVNSTRLNAYLDASLAPYKDNLRFWFGARLVLISIIYIVIANRGTGDPTLTLTLELSCLVGFTVIQAYIQPFKSLWVSLVDLSFLLNLIALTLGTSYTIQGDARSSEQNVLVNFSLSIAFITQLGITLWHLFQRLHKNEKFRNKSDKILAVVMMFVSAIKLRKKKEIMEMITKQREGQENGVGDEGDDGRISGARFHNRSSDLAPPPGKPPSSSTFSLQEMSAAPDNDHPEHISSSQLREPVLDFVDERHTA